MGFQNTSVRGGRGRSIGGREEEVGVGGGLMVKYTASMFNRETGGFLLLYKFI